MKRVFYNYTLWEDFKSGMYNPPCTSSIETGISSEERVAKAIECLSNETICRENMQKVVTEWVIATEQVLTNLEQNRKAWLGWCACFMYGGCHDEETRKAWGLMTEKARIRANEIADEVIKGWERQYIKRFSNYQISMFD